ncbi:hypothetical protein Ddc_10900 [Ditylenchus destructor]|nr:hypothetical protein Ddc_10900 [Ditylenchus destructor]
MMEDGLFTSIFCMLPTVFKNLNDPNDTKVTYVYYCGHQSGAGRIPPQNFETFVRGIVYVGSGSNLRPYHHIVSANHLVQPSARNPIWWNQEEGDVEERDGASKLRRRMADNRSGDGLNNCLTMAVVLPNNVDKIAKDIEGSIIEALGGVVLKNKQGE